MMKNRYICIVMLLISLALSMNVACSSGDDNDEPINNNNQKEEEVVVNLTSANLTEDGYFDGVLYYKITSNNPLEVCVAKAEKSAVTIVIPTIVNIDGNTYKCTSIGYGAFRSRTSLKSVTIGNNVKTIGEVAFRGCSGLTSLIIPNSVTTIGNSAFSGCSSLNSITLGNSLNSIGSDAFNACSQLNTISIPNSITKIGYRTFWNCI